MTPIVSDFEEGAQWRRLTREERAGTPWLYVTTRALEVRFASPIVRNLYVLTDGAGREWGSIAPNYIRLMSGYAWNGSTCAPDCDSNMLASVVHDLLYQFSGCPFFPSAISRSWADDLFYALCRAEGFWLAWAYRSGLFLASWHFWAVPPADGESIWVLSPKSA